MFTYLKIQEAPAIDNITTDGHVGSQLPWPVVADRDDAHVVVPSSMLAMKRVIGFQRDLAVMQVDVWWKDAVADPQQVVGMYVVSEHIDGHYRVNVTAVDSAEIVESEHEIPVER